MNFARTATRMMTSTLLAGGIAVGLASAGAADTDHGGGTWCPGQPLPQAYNFRIIPGGGACP